MTDDPEHPDWFGAADAGPEPTVLVGDYDSEYDWFDHLEPTATPTTEADDGASGVAEGADAERDGPVAGTATDDGPRREPTAAVNGATTAASDSATTAASDSATTAASDSAATETAGTDAPAAGAGAAPETGADAAPDAEADASASATSDATDSTDSTDATTPEPDADADVDGDDGAGPGTGTGTPDWEADEDEEGGEAAGSDGLLGWIKSLFGLD